MPRPTRFARRHITYSFVYCQATKKDVVDVEGDFPVRSFKITITDFKGLSFFLEADIFVSFLTFGTAFQAAYLGQTLDECGAL